MALVIPLLTLLGGFFIAGYAQTSNVNAKASGEANQGLLSFLKNVLTGGAFAALYHKLVKAPTSRYALAQMGMLTRWILHLEILARNVIDTQTRVAESTADAVVAALHRTSPQAFKRATAPAVSQANKATARATKAQATANTATSDLTKYKAKTTPKVTHATHAVDVAIPKDIAGLRARDKALTDGQNKTEGRVKSLEDGAIKTFEWIRSHPLSAATGVFAGAVAIALSRMGFGFLRCRDWQKLGKRVTCGMGRWLGSLLDLIATFALAGFAVLDPEALAKRAVDAVDAIEPLLDEILSR